MNQLIGIVGHVEKDWEKEMEERKIEADQKKGKRKIVNLKIFVQTNQIF